MMNLNSRKSQKIISKVIIGILVLAMILSIIVPFV